MNRPRLLAPSILSFDLSMLGESVPALARAGAQIIHFDVMDGQFVPPITFGAALLKSLRTRTDAFFEAHLMVADPQSQLDEFAAAGCQRIIFHAEGAHHANRLVHEIRTRGMQTGVAINPGTPVGLIAELIPIVDLALVMTVNPGWGGQPMIPATLDKVREIHGLRPDLHIQVDGGVDLATLPLAMEAGANVFVVGSALLKPPGVPETVQTFLRAMEPT